MSCTCVGKVILILLNVIFMLTGIVFLICGSLLAFVPSIILTKIFDFVKIAAKTNETILPEDVDKITNFPMIFEVGIAVLIFGAFLMVLSFLGYCGSLSICCEWMLIVFVIIIVTFMIVEIIIGSFFFVGDSALHSNIRSNLKNELRHYNESNTDDVFSQSINIVQLYFKCCGVDNATDYTVKPKSCKTYITGCYTDLNNIIQDNIVYASAGLGGILLLQLIEVIFAIVIFI